MIFNLLEHQKPLVYSDCPVILVSGAYRSAKTDGCIHRALKIATTFPGSRGLVGGTSIARHINGRLMPGFKEYENPDYFNVDVKIGKNRVNVITNNGLSTIDFYPMAEKGMENKFISYEYDWAFIDEPVACNEDVVKAVPSRLSGRRALIKGEAPFFMSTYPDRPDHWLKLW